MSLYEYRRTIFLGFLFVGFLLFIYFLGFPFLVTRSVSLISTDMEISLGEMAFEQYVSEQKINDDPNIRMILNKCARTVETFDTTRQMSIQIVVIEDTIPNAFSLPGGYIVIYRGILDLMENESELMGLLAHEAGHIYLRHGLRQFAREIYVGILVAILAGDNQEISSVLFSNSAMLLNLAYSRSQEEAADDFAFRALGQAKLNQQGLITLFEKLRETEEKTNLPPTFLSTHPATAERVARIARQLSDSTDFLTVLTEEEWNRFLSFEFAVASHSGSNTVDLRSLETLPEKAAALREMGQYNDALKLVEAAIKIDSLDTLAYFERGVLYYEVEEYQKALADFDRVIAIDPTDKWAYAHKGSALYYLDRDEEAVIAFTEAILRDPQYIWAHNERGRLYLWSGEYLKALADFDKAIEIDPNYQWAHANRGITLHRLNRPQEALAALEKALIIDPQYDYAFGQRGRIYSDLGDYEKAISDFTKAIELDPNDHRVYEQRSMAFRRNGQNEEALKDINKAIELNHQCAFSYNQLGYTYMKMELYDEGIAAYQKSIEVDSGSSNSYGNMGWLYYLKGDFQSCIECSQKAVALDSTALYAMYNTALSYLRLGQIEKSKEMYIKTRQYNLALGLEIAPGVIQDLKDLVEKDIMVVEAGMILREIFELSEDKI